MAAFPRWTELPSPELPISTPERAASKQTLRSLFDSQYWKSVCPDLRVENSPKCGPSVSLPLAMLQDLRRQVATEGVTQVGSEQLCIAVEPFTMAKSVVALMQHGWPPSFLLLFDEIWDVIQQMGDVMLAATGNQCNMDILAWYVDPNNGDVGFSPHRDRQPDDSLATFRKDGSAMYSTCWIPFTDACPENSCLYVIPRWSDPGYFTGDADEDDAPTPLQLSLPTKEAYQNIRVCPAPAGSAVIFTHRTIHWGSKGRRGYHTPRVCMSFGCADDLYEAAYFPRKHLPHPPFRLRVALACAQMLVYHERFPFNSRMLALFHRAFKQEAAEFDPEYRQKVMAEFVAASKQVLDGEAAAGQALAWPVQALATQVQPALTTRVQPASVLQVQPAVVSQVQAAVALQDQPALVSQIQFSGVPSTEVANPERSKGEQTSLNGGEPSKRRKVGGADGGTELASVTERAAFGSKPAKKPAVSSTKKDQGVQGSSKQEEKRETVNSIDKHRGVKGSKKQEEKQPSVNGSKKRNTTQQAGDGTKKDQVVNRSEKQKVKQQAVDGTTAEQPVAGSKTRKAKQQAVDGKTSEHAVNHSKKQPAAKGNKQHPAKRCSNAILSAEEDPNKDLPVNGQGTLSGEDEEEGEGWDLVGHLAAVHGCGDDELGSDVLEDALEAMLDAEEGGAVFQDDFDDMQDGKDWQGEGDEGNLDGDDNASNSGAFQDGGEEDVEEEL